MLQLTQLNEKVILNKSIILKLHSETDFQNEVSLSFESKIDGLLQDHLRGMEFSVKRQVKDLILSRDFSSDDDFQLSYYDIAMILLSLDLPVKQVVKNFQNWILMSTEYALPVEDTIKLCLTAEFDKAAEWEVVLAEEASPLPSPLELKEEQRSEEIEVTEILEETSVVNLENLPDETPVEFSMGTVKKYKLNYKMLFMYLAGIAFCLTLILMKQYDNSKQSNLSFKDVSNMIVCVDPKPVELKLIVNVLASNHSNGYPDYLAYEPINEERLKGYLKRRNSLLADEPYFSAIVKAAASEDVNPYLLFAITGQEQGFVKRGTVNSALIVNNPFNVYNSWVEYNTSIDDSSKVAAQTVRIILSDRPKGENPFKWLNKTYAEDPKWWVGTESLFLQIEEHIRPNFK